MIKEKTTKKILFIGQVWPEPETTAAGQNILSYVQAFKKHQWNIHFWSAADVSEHSFDLSSLDINTHPIQINDDKFNDLLSKLDPNVVVFDRFISEEQFGWRVSDVCPDSLRVINLEDLHGVREARHLLYKAVQHKNVQHNDLFQTNEIFKAENAHYLYNDKTLRELASIYRSDLVITLSEKESDALIKTFNVNCKKVMHLPFIRSNKVQRSLSFNERKGAVFIGNMQHKPNVISVEFITKFIWPKIRQAIPDCELNIYGEYATNRIKQLHSPQNGVYVNGHTKELKNVLAYAKLLLAPLQIGAGVKGKLIDAMTQSTPSVTTPIGVEGIPHNVWPGEVCDSKEKFINASMELLLNKSAWDNASENCQAALVNSGVSLENENLLIKGVERALSELTIRRQEDPVQKVLMLQTMQASRYLSKWIMLKNNE